MLDHLSFLIVDKTEVVSIFSHLSQNKVRMGKAIADRHSFQSSNLSLVLNLFVLDLLTDGRGVFACVALSEDDQWVVSSKSELIEAAILIEKELLKGIVEIIGYVFHRCAIGAWLVVGISVTEPGSYRLINKEHIVMLYPCEIILYDFVRCHVGRAYEMGA